jgi:hypothetical protein
VSDTLDSALHDSPDAEIARLQGEVDRLTAEREENREIIGELEAELRNLRPSPGGMR